MAWSRFVLLQLWNQIIDAVQATALPLSVSLHTKLLHSLVVGHDFVQVVHNSFEFAAGEQDPRPRQIEQVWVLSIDCSVQTALVPDWQPEQLIKRFSFDLLLLL